MSIDLTCCLKKNTGMNVDVDVSVGVGVTFKISFKIFWCIVGVQCPSAVGTLCITNLNSNNGRNKI